MLVTAVLFAVVGAIAAQFPPQPSTCASTLCLVGTTCKEVYDPVTGVVQGACLTNVRPTGNENVCGPDGGQPLYVNSSTLGVVEINCGRSPNRIACVHGYYCNIHPADRYAVCCPGDGAAPPTEKPGECPAPGDLRCLRIKNCNGDQSCPGDRKCCKNQCGGYNCVAPVKPTPTCDNTPCPAGERCEMQVVVCKKAPCNPVRTCVPIVNPGVCPASSGLVGPCVFRPGYNCLGDFECRAGQKCCSEGCGRICKNVVYS